MTKNNSTHTTPVQMVNVPVEHVGRRIDNFLLGYLGNIPKTRIYKMLRKGEVRINKKRVKPDYRLLEGDSVRIPPVFSTAETGSPRLPDNLLKLIQNSILYEDNTLLLINKPAGIAVHAGSGEKYGIIELMCHLRPGEELELVHRLDKPTSGCLLLARDHRVLRQLHTQLRDSTAEKHYLALVKGRLQKPRTIEAALNKNVRIEGERKVLLDKAGKAATSTFTPLQYNRNLTLARVKIKTGRTHQIRVHAAAIGHPVAGDDKYGDRNFNRQMRQKGLKRMFLHAETITIKHPITGKSQKFTAALPADLSSLLQRLMNEKRSSQS